VKEPRNRVVKVRHFGGPDGLEVVDAPMPTAGRGEVRVRVLASGLEYTDVLIRRHLYPQTMRRSFGERKLYRICWQTIFVSEIRQAVDTVRICLVSRTFLTPSPSGWKVIRPRKLRENYTQIHRQRS
jgi:hypothetical protein